MQRIKQCVLLVCSFLLFACQNHAATKNNTSVTTTTSTTQTTQTSQATFNGDLSTLNHTSHFLPSALKHIFAGEINARGLAVGYHYEGYDKAIAKVIEHTRSTPDKNGVYRAKIIVNHIEKNAYSTFFPKEWSMQQIVDAINEAYETKQLQSGNIYNGSTQYGIIIQMYLTENGKIISAFPLYNK